MHFYRNEPMELVEGSGKRVRERKRENRVILLFPMMILTNVVCTLLTGSDVTEPILYLMLPLMLTWGGKFPFIAALPLNVAYDKLVTCLETPCIDYC